MLTAQQKTLRKFWYATMAVSYLAEGTKPLRLTNEDIMLFLLALKDLDQEVTGNYVLAGA